MKKLSVAEVMLLKEIEKAGLPAPVRNYKHKETGLRSNFAWPDKKIAAILQKLDITTDAHCIWLNTKGWDGIIFNESNIKASIKYLRTKLEGGRA